MIIDYKNKEDLVPKFGQAFPKENRIEIRKDLPQDVINFLIKHEKYHLIDRTKFWLWREIKANYFGAKNHPIGFLFCCVLSLSFSRLKFYLKRILLKC